MGYHSQIVLVHKRPLALAAAVVLVVLMLDHLILGRPRLVAHATLPGEVVCGLHVLEARPLGAEAAGAGVALERGEAAVAGGANVVVEGLPSRGEHLVAGAARVAVARAHGYGVLVLWIGGWRCDVGSGCGWGELAGECLIQGRRRGRGRAKSLSTVLITEWSESS